MSEFDQNWGADEIFRDEPPFLGSPDLHMRNCTGSRGKKYQFLASLSIAGSIASEASETPQDAYDIYNDLFTELSLRNAPIVSNTSHSARDSKRLVRLIEELKSFGSVKSLSGIAISSYLEGSKLAHRLMATTDALENKSTVVLPFPHDLAPGGMQLKRRVPVWGVLTSYPNVPLGEAVDESSVLDETTTASVVFPTYDNAVRINMLPDDLVSAVAPDNTGVSDGNTGFIVSAH